MRAVSVPLTVPAPNVPVISTRGVGVSSSPWNALPLIGNRASETIAKTSTPPSGPTHESAAEVITSVTDAPSAVTCSSNGLPVSVVPV